MAPFGRTFACLLPIEVGSSAKCVLETVTVPTKTAIISNHCYRLLSIKYLTYVVKSESVVKGMLQSKSTTGGMITVMQCKGLDVHRAKSHYCNLAKNNIKL